jgi:hypothetical protein
MSTKKRPSSPTKAHIKLVHPSQKLETSRAAEAAVLSEKSKINGGKRGNPSEKDEDQKLGLQRLRTAVQEANADSEASTKTRTTVPIATVGPSPFQGQVYHIRGVRFFKATGPHQEPQKAALAFGQSHDHTFYFAHQNQWGYAYASCPNAEEFCEWYDQYQGTKHFYELILQGKPACLCLDVEKYQMQRDDNEAQCLLEDVLDLVLAALQKVELYPTLNSFVISVGSRDVSNGYKVSYHISHPGIVFETFEGHQKAFFETCLLPLVNRRMQPEDDPDAPDLWLGNNAEPTKDIVDSSIYTKNRQMRLVGSSKFGSDQPLVLMRGMARDSLVSAPQQSVNVVVDGLVITNKKVKGQKRTLQKAAQQRLPAVVPPTPANPFTQQQQLSSVLTLLRKFDPHSSLMEKEPGRFYDVRTNGVRVCPFKETHSSQNGYIKVAEDGTVWYHCYPSGQAKACAGKGAIIGKLDGPADQVLNTNGLASVTIYSAQYVRPLHLRTRVLAVRAHCGSGKSKATNDLIVRVRGMQALLTGGFISDDTKRIIIISPRISFSKAIMGALKLHGFVLYSDVDNLHDCVRLIVQYESLHRLLEGSIQYDLVILDELETILECALSTKTNKRHLLINGRVFEALNKNAHKVVALDADLSNKGLDMLKTMVGAENITLDINTYQRLPRTLSLYEDDLVWRQHLHEKITEHKRLIIAVTSKEFADKHIVPLLQTVAHAYYHVDNKDEREALIDINEEWCKYQVVMFTPCITVGCDFSVHDHFHEVWAMAASNSAVPRQLFQMMWRCRHPKSPIMHVLVKRAVFEGDLPLTTDAVMAALRRKIVHCSDIESELRANWRLQVGDDMRMQWVGDDDWLTQVYAHSEVEKNRAKKDFVSEVERLAKEKQCDVVRANSSILSRSHSQTPQDEMFKQQQIETFDATDLVDNISELKWCGDELSAWLCRKHDYCAQFKVAVDGQHWWDCHRRLSTLYSIQRVHTQNPAAQLEAEASDGPQHVAFDKTHFACIHMMHQLAAWLGLTSPLDTDTALTKAVWQEAAKSILPAQERLSSVFDVRIRLTETAEPWQQAKTITNQVYTNYVRGSFKVATQSWKRGATRGDRTYKLQFEILTGLQTFWDVSQTLVGALL